MWVCLFGGLRRIKAWRRDRRGFAISIVIQSIRTHTIVTGVTQCPEVVVLFARVTKVECRLVTLAEQSFVGRTGVTHGVCRSASVAMADEADAMSSLILHYILKCPFGPLFSDILLLEKQV